LAFYNLKDDPSETKNLATGYPEVAARLARLLSIGRSELGDSVAKMAGTSTRAPGVVQQ
jgi:hypothetical protein